MDRFINMQTFVKVVEVGSFAEASRRLAISKAVTTKRINQLEELLGRQLLRRTTRSLRVTDAGHSYYQHCLTILADVENAEADIRSLSLEPRGHLRISSPASFAVTYLGAELCQFQHQYEQLSIELLHNERAVNPLTEGYDVCIQVLPVYGDNIAQRPIAPVRRVVVASPDYLKRFGEPQHPTDLQHHRCIHNIYLEPMAEWTFYGAGSPISVQLNPVMKTNNGWLLRDAAYYNNCIAVLPLHFIESELMEGSLIPILKDYHMGLLWLTAYYPAMRPMPFKTKLFLDHLEAVFGVDPPWERQLINTLGPRLAGTKNSASA